MVIAQFTIQFAKEADKESTYHKASVKEALHDLQNILEVVFWKIHSV